MRIYIYKAIVIAISVYAGYWLGIYKNNQYTMEYMNFLNSQYIAIRAANGIHGISNMKNHIMNKNLLLCEMKKEVSRLSEDWMDCKSDKACSKEVDGGFFSNIDGIISEFKNETCEDN
ncbi:MULTISPECIES: hypothetical protein [unclassified Delftia]|jgi:hypothetical protein|uniref:hypothetical protein n=1 Tax=unclassified Delftia TaxID=2613839 RepID=UPI0018FFC997|nr:MULTISPECIES: hypothetical protein [unclassified Delftia]MBK0111251.1 hypothetical protein [Delftia sp. S65]MBK0116979.1 hypothetical protein [Delftia sp. S67]MBK0128426.1 hypothetical protein [Delftia sp. S66]